MRQEKVFSYGVRTESHWSLQPEVVLKLKLSFLLERTPTNAKNTQPNQSHSLTFARKERMKIGMRVQSRSSYIIMGTGTGTAHWQYTVPYHTYNRAKTPEVGF